MTFDHVSTNIFFCRYYLISQLFSVTLKNNFSLFLENLFVCVTFEIKMQYVKNASMHNNQVSNTHAH